MLLMKRARQSWFTVLGAPDREHAALKKAAERHQSCTWTIHSRAEVGDRVAFYLTAPTSAVVATGTVDSEPERMTNRHEPWSGKHMATIRNIRMLATPMTREGLAQQMADWGWLSQPRLSAQIPASQVVAFERLLAASGSGRLPSPQADLEGALREVRVFRRQRSRRLRDQALLEAKGKCTACQVDFSLVAAGLGKRVLQVHHKRPLASSRTERPTRLADLAVVCANCHLMLHAEHGVVMSVDRLRQRLRLDGKNRR